MARRPPLPPRAWNRYAAPVAFLAAATLAVLLVRSALQHKVPAPPARATVAASTTTAAATTTAKAKPASTGPAARYHVVQAGETFGTIAAAEGTTVASIEQLNPGVASTSLHVGQKIRVG